MNAKLAIALLLTAGAVCLAYVLSGQYASGNIYSEYSSLRTDRFGARALFEALERTHPGVSRSYVPLRSMTPFNSGLLVLGLSPTDLTEEFIDGAEAIARRGNRVVIALNASYWTFGLGRVNPALRNKWKLRVVDPSQPAHPEDEEERVRRWLYFEPGPEWSEFQRTGGHSVAIERRFGAGSVAMVASSWPFSNLGLRRDRNLALLDWSIGNGARIFFDESHLGSVEQGTIMGLARQFRLQGLIAVLIACALLFVWQASAPFPPERSVAAHRDFQLSAASAGEGLRNLLTRHIASPDIVAACLSEWTKDKGREVVPHPEVVPDPKLDPVGQWKQIRAALAGKKRRA